MDQDTNTAVVENTVNTDAEFEAASEAPTKRKGRTVSKKPCTVFTVAVPKHGKRTDGALAVTVPYNDAEGVRHVANVVLSVNEAGELTFTT